MPIHLPYWLALLSFLTALLVPPRADHSLRGAGVYRSNNEFRFRVSRLVQGKVQQVDTISLVTTDTASTLNPGQLACLWRYNGGREEYTGLLDNDAEVWLHPPRSGRYKVLELAPFPTLRYPLTPGHSWLWQLDVGSAYSDSRYAVWEGIKRFEHTYRIGPIQKRLHRNRTLSCYPVYSQCTSDLGLAKLVAYYNPEFGFVRLDYQTINQEHITFELIAIVPIYKPINEIPLFGPK